MRMTTGSLLLATTVALLGAGRAEVAGQKDYRIDREQELRLAMSAGPLSVSKDADVYLFGRDGFHKEIVGTNGFACMVIRDAASPEILAPHCFSPDAVETVLPAKLVEGRLVAAGRSADEVEAELLDRFGSGSLALPSGNAYAYMLSSGQSLGPAGNWRPHFMLYVPYATNEDVGGVPGEPAFPFVGPVVDHPHSTMVIVMTEFVNPSDVVLPRG